MVSYKFASSEINVSPYVDWLHIFGALRVWTHSSLRFPLLPDIPPAPHAKRHKRFLSARRPLPQVKQLRSRTLEVLVCGSWRGILRSACSCSCVGGRVWGLSSGVGRSWKGSGGLIGKDLPDLKLFRNPHGLTAHPTPLQVPPSPPTRPSYVLTPSRASAGFPKRLQYGKTCITCICFGSNSLHKCISVVCLEGCIYI